MLARSNRFPRGRRKTPMVGIRVGRRPYLEAMRKGVDTDNLAPDEMTMERAEQI